MDTKLVSDNDSKQDSVLVNVESDDEGKTMRHQLHRLYSSVMVLCVLFAVLVLCMFVLMHQVDVHSGYLRAIQARTDFLFADPPRIEPLFRGYRRITLVTDPLPPS